MPTGKRKKKKRAFWKDVKFKYKLAIVNENALGAVALVENAGEPARDPYLHFELWHKGRPVNPDPSPYSKRIRLSNKRITQ